MALELSWVHVYEHEFHGSMISTPIALSILLAAAFLATSGLSHSAQHLVDEHFGHRTQPPGGGWCQAVPGHTTPTPSTNVVATLTTPRRWSAAPPGCSTLLLGCCLHRAIATRRRRTPACSFPASPTRRNSAAAPRVRTSRRRRRRARMRSSPLGQNAGTPRARSR
jgi:hypothetical protein